ncbi:MAG: acetate/propionate family kinase [Candidatus Saccharimonadales bacterium]
MISVSFMTANVGSSSIKLDGFADADGLNRVFALSLTGIGQQNGKLVIKTSDDKQSRELETGDQDQALNLVLQELDRLVDRAGLQAIGHRLVHGGPELTGPVVITDKTVAGLEDLAVYDPDHTPAALGMIRALAKRYDGIKQVACFDTAFFHNIPRVAQIIAVPRKYQSLGLRRYGFHGLSYTYLQSAFRRVAGDAAADGRVIYAHLGSGASLAATAGGQPVDMTMGFSPASGVVMSSRSGDLDPGVFDFLHRQGGLELKDISHMVNKESGLLGVSGKTADMLALLHAQTSDEAAAEAVELFCYSIRKAIGALASTIGGLDSLIFAGGIGEQSPEIRRRICEGLEYLGIGLDESANSRHAGLISAPGSRAGVHVLATDEAVVICRQTADVTEDNQ